MNISTDAAIRVATIFEPGKRLRPVWLAIKGQKHTVKEVTYNWMDTVGSKTLQHFTVLDEKDTLYHLVFSPSDSKWVMAELNEVARA